MEKKTKNKIWTICLSSIITILSCTIVFLSMGLGRYEAQLTKKQEEIDANEFWVEVLYEEAEFWYNKYKNICD